MSQRKIPAASATGGDQPPTNLYGDCVRQCLDNLLAYGTDRYGPVKTPMVMSIIDVQVNESPRDPLLLDGWVRSEERPGRRNPGGCDLWDDQPLAAAQTCLYAYEVARDPALLEGARNWARHIRASFPPVIGRRWREEIHAAMPEAIRKDGAYAEGYGRAISFFVHLYRATGDQGDWHAALGLADEAMDKLCENGWVKGHAGKPYYETTDGVGLLLCALLEVAESKTGETGE